MATYIVLFGYTQLGIQDIKESPARVDAAEKAFKAMGAKVKEFYAVMGMSHYDTIFIVEAPDDETVTALGEHIPRVTDQFNGFLRELRTDDLSGSAGAYRLRLELLRRVNLVIAPMQINAVLIEEMLVQ